MNQLCRITLCFIVLSILSGCTKKDTPPASISSVGDSGATNRRGEMQPSATQNGQIVYNRNYRSIPKGGYTGGTYQVKRGDTLFYIAWISGTDFRDLAQRNNIPEPYHLEVGQIIKTGVNGVNTVDNGKSSNSELANNGRATQTNLTAAETAPEKAPVSTTIQPGNTKVTSSAEPVTPPPVATGSWIWPTQGKIIDNFSSAEGGNKGIDIAGTREQPVLATASGRVVYAGNALRGYGNLIIIKHNDDYLSAYAHNDNILVREQEDVKAGQKIATMGSTGTSSVRLHFEIRYKGKSVNPLRYLPQR
ncbi:MAG: peptidoglycan DD-metalloendopeptidase family protein [Enterobacteriaceae bacterium]